MPPQSGTPSNHWNSAAPPKKQRLAAPSQSRERLRVHSLPSGKMADSIMANTISEPRSDISEYAPKILTLTVPEDKIGAVIGTGGKTIKAIAAQSNAEINIEDNGTVMIYGRNNASAQEAKRLVLAIIEEPEVGHIYHGTVKRIVDFGAFIEILPGKEGLCHISKLAKTRVKNVSDVLSVGQQVDVKLTEIDRMGRLNLSYIDAQPESAEKK